MSIPMAESLLARTGQFRKIGPENDQTNFLSVHLRNPYSDNMTEPQQTRQHSPTGRQKVRCSYICHERIGANLAIASSKVVEEYLMNR